MDSVSRKEYRKQAIKHLENSTEQLEQAAKNKLFVAELEVVKASLAQLKGEANSDSVAKDAAQKLDASEYAEGRAPPHARIHACAGIPYTNTRT